MTSRLDQLRFTFVLAAPAHVKLVAGKELVYEGDLGAGPQELRWDGRMRDGKYAAVLEATGPFGTRGQTARFAADTKKPVVPAALEGAAPLHRERAGDRDRHGRRRAGSRRRRAGPLRAFRRRGD